MARRKRAVAESKQVERARKKFRAWRRSRKGPSRIPDDLWELAVGAAREVGVNQASRALGLEYYALKKRVVASADGPALEPSQSFVEFDSSAAPPFFTEWAVELENGRGARMRVAVRSPGGPDVVGLCRAFRGEES
jgi:hypothetical protein